MLFAASTFWIRGATARASTDVDRNTKDLLVVLRMNSMSRGPLLALTTAVHSEPECRPTLPNPSQVGGGFDETPSMFVFDKSYKAMASELLPSD